MEPLILPEQYGVIFGLIVRQAQVVRVDYAKYTRRDVCFDIIQRWVFGTFLFFFFDLLNLRTLLGTIGIGMDVGTGIGGFLTGFGVDAFLSWITARFYPEWRIKLENLRKRRERGKGREE